MNTLVKSFKQFAPFQTPQKVSNDGKPSEALEELFQFHEEFLKELDANDANKEEFTKPEVRKNAEEVVGAFKEVMKNTLDELASGKMPENLEEILGVIIGCIGAGLAIGTIKGALTLIKEKTDDTGKPPEPVVCPK